MTNEQVRQAEETVMEIISKNPPVFANEAPLPLAKEVQGLRACFDEVCRSVGILCWVVSVGTGGI